MRFPLIINKRLISCSIWLALVFSSTVACGQPLSLKDDFETGELSPIWATDKLANSALCHISSPTRTGNGALSVTLAPYDKAEFTKAGNITERAELMEASAVRLKMGVEAWYAFSFLLPSDFPIVKTRLVIAQWKQACLDCSLKRSPMVSLRYIDQELKVYIENMKGRGKLFQEKMDLLNRWVDMVFRIMPKADGDGILQVWMDGRQIVDYQGALGFTDNKEETYFKMGLYRNHMGKTMQIIIDRFRRGSSFEEVALSDLDGQKQGANLN